jgi:hypothetical protein
LRKDLEEHLYAIEPAFFEGFVSGCECGDGWFPIIRSLIGLAKSTFQDFHIQQIKEKFGGLRFYTYGGDEEFDGAVRMAEKMSLLICENCGAWGHCREDRGWAKTLCDVCVDGNFGLTSFSTSFKNAKPIYPTEWFQEKEVKHG